MEEGQLSKEQQEKIKSIISDISDIKKINNIEKFNEMIKALRDKARTTPLSIIQKFSIIFYSFYNHIIPKSNNKDTIKLKEISNHLINGFQNINKSTLQNEIDEYFPVLKNDKISDDKGKDKDDYEICFSLCLLSKNIKLTELFFSYFLNVTIFQDDDMNSMDLENPIAFELIDSLFKNLYVEIKAGKRDNLKIIIEKCFDDSNTSLNKLFRCNKCYNFMMMKFEKKKENNNEEKIVFKVKCLNCDKKFQDYKYNEFKATFICVECDKTLIMYKQNYKCTKCKKFVCLKCINKHCDKCCCLRFIELYKIGYRCELHNSKYIYYCSTCDKNLCIICKDIHPHIIENSRNIYNEVIELYKEMSLMKKIAKDDIQVRIKYNLSFLYINDNKYQRFNGYLYRILCEIFEIDLNPKNKQISFTKFNNKEFNDYYSKLLTKASNGDTYSLNCLDSLKSLYSKKNIIEFKINYNKIINRQNNIRNFIEDCKLTWLSLINIHKMINYDDKLKDSKIYYNNLKIKNDELDSKLLIYNNSNIVYKENTHNIISRFFANELIVSLLAKYSEKFDKISLNFSIFIDLITRRNYNILSNKEIINFILDISKNFIKDLEEYKETHDESVQKNLEENIVKYLNPHKNIVFVEDIKIGKDTFKKEELNQILDILFFIKDKGNITAHPNIDLNKSLKISHISNILLEFEINDFYGSSLKEKIEKEINKNIENIEDTYEDNFPVLIENNEDDDIYYKLNNYSLDLKNKYNSIKNINDYRDGAMDDIIQKILNIRDDIFSRLKNYKIKKDVQTKDIIETIFEGKDNQIIEELNEFKKVFLSATDNVIKKYLNINIEEKLAEENNNFNDLIKTLEDIKLILENFIEFNIPRHKHLEIYINKIIDDTKFDYSLFKREINKLERRILKEYDQVVNYGNNKIKIDLDCENNEIIIEAYFLLMLKTYENEKQLLKEIKKKYETELIKIIIYEEIEQKLNEVQQLFEKEFNDNSYDLSKLIKDNYFSDKKADKITYERVKYIMCKMLDEKICLGESKDSKLSIDSRLFKLQNLNNK